MKSLHYSKLTNHKEKTIVHFAARARFDTLFGGVLGLTLAKRAESMGSKNDLVAVVSDVYSNSTGKPHKSLEAWECPECEQACLGQEIASKCCEKVQSP